MNVKVHFHDLFPMINSKLSMFSVGQFPPTTFLPLQLLYWLGKRKSFTPGLLSKPVQNLTATRATFIYAFCCHAIQMFCIINNACLSLPFQSLLGFMFNRSNHTDMISWTVNKSEWNLHFHSKNIQRTKQFWRTLTPSSEAENWLTDWFIPL